MVGSMLHGLGPIRSQKVRDAAEGERCTLEIQGVCHGRPETTVLAHIPGDQGGIMGGKEDDICACFACSACHDVIDGRVPWPSEAVRSCADWYMRRAMLRTWRRLVAKGVITIEGVKQ